MLVALFLLALVPPAPASLASACARSPPAPPWAPDVDTSALRSSRDNPSNSSATALRSDGDIAATRSRSRSAASAALDASPDDIDLANSDAASRARSVGSVAPAADARRARDSEARPAASAIARRTSSARACARSAAASSVRAESSTIAAARVIVCSGESDRSACVPGFGPAASSDSNSRSASAWRRTAGSSMPATACDTCLAASRTSPLAASLAEADAVTTGWRAFHDADGTYANTPHAATAVARPAPHPRHAPPLRAPAPLNTSLGSTRDATPSASASASATNASSLSPRPRPAGPDASSSATAVASRSRRPKARSSSRAARSTVQRLAAAITAPTASPIDSGTPIVSSTGLSFNHAPTPAALAIAIPTNAATPPHPTPTPHRPTRSEMNARRAAARATARVLTARVPTTNSTDAGPASSATAAQPSRPAGAEQFLPSAAMPIREVLAQLLQGRVLTRDQASDLFEEILSGRADEAQIGAALALIQARSPQVAEITGAAAAMRRHVTPIPGVDAMSGRVIDTCGTGGAPKTFNISTIAAVVAAAAAPHRVRVAKHGNRSRTGRGSAELLANLGVNIDATPAQQARCLREASVCFCYAPAAHPAMKHAAGARRSLGFPTLFNVVGPLTNPARATRQVMGVYDRALVDKVAHALAELGTDHAMVVHSHDGLDEIALSAPTTIGHVRGRDVRTDEFEPRDLGLPRVPLAAIACDGPEHAARIATDVLAARAGPCREVVVVNAAAALLVAEAADDWHAALAAAARAIDSGDARATVDALARLSHEPAGPA